MTKKELHEINHKLKILRHAESTGNVSRTCRFWGISRDTFYRWKRKYETDGETGLINRKPCPENIALRITRDIEDKALYMRCTYHFGPAKISWYLKRYLRITVSVTGVYGVLRRHGLNRLPRNSARRQTATMQRYQKQEPGQHIQMDVMVLDFKDRAGCRVRRYQYTAIDDATRLRAMKIYESNDQDTAMDFASHVVEKFPFQIHMIRTDNGHEFRAKFHEHVLDLGPMHFRIKHASPNLNGKVERSHLTDQREFYQLVTYNGDADLQGKLTQWEMFYNCERPHASLNGKTPWEVLLEKLKET